MKTRIAAGVITLAALTGCTISIGTDDTPPPDNEPSTTQDNDTLTDGEQLIVIRSAVRKNGIKESCDLWDDLGTQELTQALNAGLDFTLDPENIEHVLAEECS